MEFASQFKALMLGMKKYSPPLSTLNVSMPWMRRLTGCLRNGEGRPFLLPPDDRVTLAVGADEIAVVDPLLLQEFDRGHRLGADEQEDGAARHFVVLLRTARSDRRAVHTSCRA